jgi:hypothetical protein
MLSNINGITLIPATPVCNMFHIHFSGSEESLRDQLIEVMKSCDVALFGGFSQTEDGYVKSEMTIGDAYEEVHREKLLEAIALFKVMRNNVADAF